MRLLPAILFSSICILVRCGYNPESVSTADKLVATWALIESYDLCVTDSADYPGDTVKKTVHIDSFLVITRNEMHWYDIGTCQPFDSIFFDTAACVFADWFCGEYAFSNDSLTGGMHEGSQAYGSGQIKWCTTVQITSQRLTLERHVWTEGAADYIRIWRKRIFE